MKPLQHSQVSAHRYGGHFRDYQPFHDFIDSSKAVFASVQHRIFFHSDWGGEICRELFGETVTNADGIKVETARLFEDHMIEDLGRVVPLRDWLEHVRPTRLPDRPAPRFRDIRERPAEALAKRWGGSPETYQKMLDLMDSPGRYAPDQKALLLTHSSFGIFLVEKIIGSTLEVVSSCGTPRYISTRSPLEDLVQARLGRIPRGSEIAERTFLNKWMVGSEVTQALVTRSRQEKEML